MSMTRKEALQIVLSLANDNQITFEQCQNDDKLLAEMAKQEVALMIVTELQEEVYIIDNVMSDIWRD